jgi:hypothetical protein
VQQLSNTITVYIYSILPILSGPSAEDEQKNSLIRICRHSVSFIIERGIAYPDRGNMRNKEFGRRANPTFQNFFGTSHTAARIGPRYWCRAPKPSNSSAHEPVRA